MRNDPTCCVMNFQTDTAMRDALHAAAESSERTASAIIRLAVRAWLAKHDRASKTKAPAQHEQEATA
jgi:hypothetical protein